MKFLFFLELLFIMITTTSITNPAPMANEKLLNDSLEAYVTNAERDFSKIPQERRIELEKIAAFIQARVKSGEPIQLTYICTHNSRRSHFGQIWGATAAAYYNIPNVKTFSGGTEATAFNERAVAACKRVGFEIKTVIQGKNPVYEVKYAANAEPIRLFSKLFSDSSNPQNGFCAIMTCTQADEACPVVKGASLRVSLPYEDPKHFDGQPNETEKYDERCKQIATETLYVFSKVKL